MIKDNIKQPTYDAWLHWNINYRCNLDCDYCFINPLKLRGPLPTVAVPEVMETLKKTGKTFRINLTGGGEPFLVKNIIELCQALTDKHYISMNTNLTSKKVRTFAEVIDPERILEIHASLHIKELERQHLTDHYIDNFVRCRNQGMPIKAVAVAHPNLVEKLDHYVKFFNDAGIPIEFGYFVGLHGGKNYPEAYTDEELLLFGLTRQQLRQSFKMKNKTCNAGYNIGFIRPSGTIRSCVQLFDNLGDITEKLSFNPHLTKCPYEFCHCPMNHYDPYLWKKALSDRSLGIKKPSLIHTTPYHLKNFTRNMIKQTSSYLNT